MGLSDDVSVVALIISLIALVVALGQLSQQVFGTADGYRRCAESVIGPWARLRYRKWIWTEFRFEVKFSTPHLMVRQIDEDQGFHDMTDENPVFFFSALPLHLKKKSGFTRKSRVLDVLNQSLRGVAPETLPRTYSSLEKSLITQDPHEIPFTTGGPQRPQRIEVRNELLASWLLLMRSLYRCTLPWQIEKHTSGRTDIAVAIREWTWDFMPFDTQRPLATSTLNHVILLALRLNMEWRRLGPDYQAGNKKYSLSSVEIRGLPGIAFQFNVEPSIRLQHFDTSCIPSAAVDKLYFGILPGCPRLVRRDLYTISEDRRLDFGPMANALGIIEHSDAFDMALGPRNDAMILICAFLPLPDSETSGHLAPHWFGDSVFHFWEGRSALVRGLQSRVEVVKGNAAATLQRVLADLQSLQTLYHSDFFDFWDQSILENATGPKKREYLNHLRRIFDFTTAFFSGEFPELSTFDWSKSSQRQERTHYLDLVAAHALMAYSTGERASDALKAFSERVKDIDERKRELGSPDAPGLVAQLYFTGEEYVSAIKDRTNNCIVEHLRGKGLYLAADDVEAAWWMLVLRGIVWDMSTVGEPWYHDKFRRLEEPIPSSLYYSQVPVWIN